MTLEEGFLLLVQERCNEGDPAGAQSHAEEVDSLGLAGYDSLRLTPVTLGCLTQVKGQGDVHL